MEDLSGQTLKSYELHERVGAGGFGVVYRAFQPLLKRPVAIKAILPEYTNHPDFIRRFEVEAELVARLEHPHIIPLYDYWREPDGAYLVMRWLGGGSLRDVLEENGPQDARLLAQWLDEIAAALTIAHRHGVVHRDIKPDNILLDEDNNAYLADFGIAKDLATVTGTEEEIIGSPAYFAPEQIRGEIVTPRTDLYSLGVMLFELLAGIQPFPESSPTEMFLKHLNEPLPPLREYRPELPVAFEAVIHQATAKDPQARYEDALQFAAAFRQALGPTSETPAVLFPDQNITDRALAPPPENPYKGLQAFQEADAADFFGRDRLIEQLLQHLSDADTAGRFLTVVGPSGSGKSSVVKAGLIPRLRRGALPGSDQWFIAQMVPGGRPFEELEIALLRIAVNPPGSLSDQLQEDERGLLRAVRRILPDDQSELVLVIDQFEEVFTQGEDPAVRARFLDSLYTAVTDLKSQIRVILTLRADFYDRPLQYLDFGELMRRQMEPVLPLSLDELKQSVVGPSERAGVALEPELVAAIVRDVGEQPGTLPLVQYALTELFERQQGRLLTLATYEEIGGITGALARRAEELYASLTSQSQEAARQIFLRLVTPGEGSEDTRRRVRRSELITASGSSEREDEVINLYGHFRLLTFDRDPVTRGPTVEIAHEALIRVWNRLREWIEDSREDVRIQRRLTAAAGEWAEAGKAPGFLVSGARLAQFEVWAAETRLVLNEEETAYLEQSIEEREAQHRLEEARNAREAELSRQAANRLRWLVAALAVFLLVALGLSAFALDRQQQAETQASIALNNAVTATLAQGEAQQQAVIAQTQAAIANKNAAEAASLALAANAQLVLSSGDTDLALLLALEAHQMVEQPSIEILRALTAAAYAPGTQYLLQGHQEPVMDVAMSPDGQLALSAASNDLDLSRNGELILWDLTTGEIRQHFEGHQNKVVAVAFDPQGQTAVSGDYSGVLILWDVATGEPLQRYQDPADNVRQVVFSPDGRSLLSSGSVIDHTVKVWGVESGDILHTLKGHSAQIDSVAYSPDGLLAASGARNGELILWDLQTGAEVRRFEGHTSSINDLAFSPDGRVLLSAGTDIGLIFWDVEMGSEIRRIPAGVIYAVAYSPDGNTVLSGLGTGSSGILTLWDSTTGAEIRRYVGHTAPVRSAVFSPDGQKILSGSEDRSVRLWYTQSGAQVQQLFRSDGVEGVDFSPDGQFVLSGARDGSVVLTDLTTGEEIHHLEGHSDIARAVVISPDGRIGLSSSLDGVVNVWDLETGDLVRRFDGHDYSVLSVDIHPDGQVALSGGLDTTGETLNGELLLWDVATGELIHRLDQPVINAVFSPDGQQALISVPGLGRNDVHLWNVEMGEIVQTFALGVNNVWGLAFSPDNRYALFGVADGTIHLWDVEAAQEIRRFVGHTDLVNSVVFSPDGEMALSASNDYSLILWDTATGAELYRFTGHTDMVRSVNFSDDGRFGLSGSRDATVRLWRAFSSSDDLVNWIRANRYLRELTCTEHQQYRLNPCVQQRGIR